MVFIHLGRIGDVDQPATVGVHHRDISGDARTSAKLDRDAGAVGRPIGLLLAHTAAVREVSQIRSVDIDRVDVHVALFSAEERDRCAVR